MAYDEALADRIRGLLAGEAGVTEMKMFGGLAFLVDGHMAIAASGQGGVMVRWDPWKDLPPGVEPVVMRGRPMDGWVRVPTALVETDEQLGRMAAMGVAQARSLPPKG